MATISQLEAQQHQLKSELNEYRKEADERIRENEMRYSRAFEKLRAQSRSLINEDRERTRRKYEELLDHTEYESNKRIDRLIKETEQKYDEVKRELDELIAEENAKLKDVYKKQEQVSEEYYENIEKQRKYAEDAIREAKEEVKRFLDVYPVEWFIPEREKIYEKEILRLQYLYESEVYQAVTGLSDSIKMQIEIDKSKVKCEMDKWFRYFSVIKSVIDNEHTLIRIDAKDLSEEELSDAFFIDEKITDKTLTPEMFTKWVDPAYEKLVSKHDNDYDFLQGFLSNSGFYGEGIPDSRIIMKCMKENLKQSDTYSVERLYDRAKNAIDRNDKELHCIQVMRSRLRAYDLRCEMFGILCDRMEELGYNCTESYYSEPNDNREAAVIVFEDFGKVVRIEVQFVPAFSTIEDKWYNGIGYSISSEKDISDIERNVDTLLRDAFYVYGAIILPANRRRAQHSPAVRTLNYSNSLKDMINGHA